VFLSHFSLSLPPLVVFKKKKEKGKQKKKREREAKKDQ